MQLVGSPVGFKQVIVQVAITVWHVEQCWRDCQVSTRNVLLRHLSAPQYSYKNQTLHTCVATFDLCNVQWAIMSAECQIVTGTTHLYLKLIQQAFIQDCKNWIKCACLLKAGKLCLQKQRKCELAVYSTIACTQTLKFAAILDAAHPRNSFSCRA